MKTVTLPQFLTEAQSAEVIQLYKTYGSTNARAQILSRVIEPNIAAINEKLGQENDASYLSYAVLYACLQAEEDRLS